MTSKGLQELDFPLDSTRPRPRGAHSAKLFTFLNVVLTKAKQFEYHRELIKLVSSMAEEIV